MGRLVALQHAYQLTVITSHNYGANFDVFFLGDFNLPGINWQTNTGTTTFERAFLDKISDFGLNQFMNEPTHVKGNCLI